MALFIKLWKTYYETDKPTTISYFQLKPKYQNAHISTFPVVILALFFFYRIWIVHVSCQIFCVLHLFKMLTSCLQHSPTHTHTHTHLWNVLSQSHFSFWYHRPFPTACLILFARTSRVPKHQPSRFVRWRRVCRRFSTLPHDVCYRLCCFFLKTLTTFAICCISGWPFESNWI